ncbi:MAG TPA: Holliday junction resolvase RuvX [Abditibacterium sp.]|jgi:RNase H-fold protein (predicted Holliday junction resolvase)
MNILGIDPGRAKTGLAVLDARGTILWRAIVPTAELRQQLEELVEKWPLSQIALGHSTGSQSAATLIRAVLEAKDSRAQLEIVDERDSTLQARDLYFEAHPRRGWRAVVPQSLQNPPVPIDDFAAVVLARRALQKASA